MRRIHMLVSLIAISCTALACGGSGGGGAADVLDPGGQPQVSASFEADQPSPSGGTVSMSEGTRSSDMVTVRIDVTGATSLFGASFDVVYNPTSVEYVGYSAGTALEHAGQGSVVYEISPRSNGLVVGATLVGTDEGVTFGGTRPLLHLTFRLLRPGAVPVGFEGEPALLDDQPEPQPIQGLNWFGGTLIGQ
jgi:hypothetical protein